MQKKEVYKLFLSSDDMILRLKVPKKSTGRLEGFVSTLNKVAADRIRIEESLAFLYSDDQKSLKELWKTVLCTILPKEISVNFKISLVKTLKN